MKTDTYQYNGLNHRVLKVTSSETRGFWYNRNWQCVEERVGDFSLLHMRYCWGLRYVDDLIFRECDSKTTPDGNINQRQYATADPNWNIVAMGANAGTPHERFTYNAFGTVNCFSGTFGTKASALYTTRFFTGQVLDKETGLMLYRNRVYHPTLGRFIQRDPIGYEDDAHSLYRYVNNNPSIYTDIMGHGILCWLFGIGCGSVVDNILDAAWEAAQYVVPGSEFTSALQCFNACNTLGMAAGYARKKYLELESNKGDADETARWKKTYEIISQRFHELGCTV